VCPVSGEDAKGIPILVNWPKGCVAESGPVTFGVPFKKGVQKAEAGLRVFRDDGEYVPSQAARTASWDDGSLRWALIDFTAQRAKTYFLEIPESPGQPGGPPRNLVSTLEAGLTVDTGVAQYRFSREAACFGTLSLDLNGDGKYEDAECLVEGAARAFYVTDSKRRTGHLRAAEQKVELNGSRHAVVRVDGDYLDDGGARLASGVVYFHFYAGFPAIRISHKLIVTEDTEQVWFRDIGMRVPFRGAHTAASFASDWANPGASFRHKLAGGEQIFMLQDEFPHFGREASHFTIASEAGGARKELLTGKACGDWCDVSTERWGLAAQVPGFAEQFPKAFRVSPEALTVKLWAAESGQELDFRTQQIVKNYFGHDWIPEGHSSMKLRSVGQGTAKTHEIWLHVHAGPLTKKGVAQLAATRHPVYATIDPAWLASSGVFGPIHPKDTKQFPETEEAISDYFDRTVVAQHKIFPQNGYLYWGMYPYTSWQLRKSGKWYPHAHRLSRFLEYNLRRGIWILYARSGDRKYFEYAKGYTRLLGNLGFSNCDASGKPKGWIVMGEWHSPINWGHFSEETIEAGKPDFRDNISCLSWASCTDVIQFVHDYFLTGDYHSRDMARMWTEAMVKELGYDLEKAMRFYRKEAFLRILGSAYELEHDPKLYDYGDRIIREYVPAEGPDILDPRHEFNFGKAGDLLSAFYYYYISTGHPLAKRAVLQYARVMYRNGRLNYFGRSSPLLQALAMAYEETGDDGYARHAARAAAGFGANYQTLADQGIDFSSLGRHTSEPWGYRILTAQSTINIGVPAALRVAAELKQPLPLVPVQVKLFPTAPTHIFLKKETDAAARIDVFVNNVGDLKHEPKLFNSKGEEIGLQVVERDYHRSLKPDFSKPLHHSIWYLTYEDYLFYRLRIPAGTPPGVYRLWLGDEVAFTILHSDIEKVVQAAPDGLVIQRGRRHHFRAPAGLEKVEFFASRPVKVRDQSGRETPLEALEHGRYAFQTGGRRGPWSIEGWTDKLAYDRTRVDVFVKMEQFPWVFALGDPNRLFEVDDEMIPARVGTDVSGVPETTYVEGKFGKALRLYYQHVEVPIPGARQDPVPGAEDEEDEEEEKPAEQAQAVRAPPHERGTVEFWFCPLWSTTDYDIANATRRVQFYHSEPISLSYWVDPDNSGRTGRYDIAKLSLRVADAGYTLARLYLQAGKWYHIAATWNVDGKDSECDLFINGRRKAFFHYKVGMLRETPASKLVPRDRFIRFGSGPFYGKRVRPELYDEVRVSSVVRYTGDFEPPTKPFGPDKDTYFLISLDADLAGEIAGKATKGVLKGGRKF